MKKDKAWLTNEIEIMGSETSENYPHEQMVDREVVLNLIDQLDEPEKVIIPQFVADEFDYEKRTYYQVGESKDIPLILKCAFENPSIDDFLDWVRENPEDYVMAVRNGYEIEKEPLYLISLPVQNRGNVNMWWNTDTGSFYFAKSSNLISQDGYKCAFTEKEIKSIDPRYWMFAEPVEESDDI